MGATEFAPKIRKRYQTNELVVDSTEFGTRGSEVQILSPRPIFSSGHREFSRAFFRATGLAGFGFWEDDEQAGSDTKVRFADQPGVIARDSNRRAECGSFCG
jgi:hypothetical protein